MCFVLTIFLSSYATSYDPYKPIKVGFYFHNTCNTYCENKTQLFNSYKSNTNELLYKFKVPSKMS